MKTHFTFISSEHQQNLQRPHTNLQISQPTSPKLTKKTQNTPTPIHPTNQHEQSDRTLLAARQSGGD